MTEPLLVILSSPSGGGKSAIARALLAARRDAGHSVSATTRVPRQGEREGVDYYFLSAAEFDRRVRAGDFAEWATYAGERYGTLNAELERLRARGLHAILDIEVQGARMLRARRTDAVAIFILPPDAVTLLARLSRRATEDPAALRARLAIALEELRAAREYDYVVVNQVLETAVAEVQEILATEGRRPGRMPQLDDQVAALARELAERAARLPAEEAPKR